MPTDPVWILDFLAAVMLLVAAYCAARVVTVRRLHRTLHYDVNTAHVAMGAAMAGMLRPDLNLLANGLWEAIFSGFAVWFTWRSVSFLAQHGIRGRSDDHVHGISHYLTHLVMSCAMLYMYFAGVPAVSSPAGMAMGPAPGTADFVVLPLLFVAVLVISAVWHLDALSRFALVGARAADSPDGQWLAPRLEMGCHIAMCVAMGFMLVLLL
jgi:Domain of unknown function (DUF5134)